MRCCGMQGERGQDRKFKVSRIFLKITLAAMGRRAGVKKNKGADQAEDVAFVLAKTGLHIKMQRSQMCREANRLGTCFGSHSDKTHTGR